MAAGSTRQLLSLDQHHQSRYYRSESQFSSKSQSAFDARLFTVDQQQQLPCLTSF